jgi:hypothetical protein
MKTPSVMRALDERYPGKMLLDCELHFGRVGNARGRSKLRWQCAVSEEVGALIAAILTLPEKQVGEYSRAFAELSEKLRGKR